jgi:hypothetical protein
MVAELLQTWGFGGMIIDRGNRNPRRKTCPSGTGTQEHKPQLQAIRN